MYDTPITIKKGEEVGYFEMGSSVILFMDDERLANIKLPLNSPIRVGNNLA
ncbi:MAG: phosphatidylserine decarboxylase [Bacteroidales bacterium]|nr:phosphatidylserine decarboxylase [Bacteroidales bacterium]